MYETYREEFRHGEVWRIFYSNFLFFFPPSLPIPFHYHFFFLVVSSPTFSVSHFFKVIGFHFKVVYLKSGNLKAEEKKVCVWGGGGVGGGGGRKGP